MLIFVPYSYIRVNDISSEVILFSCYIASYIYVDDKGEHDVRTKIKEALCLYCLHDKAL